MLPACCCAVAELPPVVGVRDLVGVGEARVVAVQPAQRVVGAAEPVVREAPAAARARARRTAASASASANRPASPPRRRTASSRDALAGVADDVDLVAVDERRRCPRSSAAGRCGCSARSATVLRARADTRRRALMLSWYIGLMFGSIVSKFGHAAVAEAAGIRPRDRGPACCVRFRLSTSSVSSDAIVDAPDVAAERAARQLVLRPVVVAAPAAEHLQAAVAAHVVRRRRGAARACRRSRTRTRRLDVRAERRDRSRSRCAGRGSASGGCRPSTGPARRATGCRCRPCRCMPRSLTS